MSAIPVRLVVVAVAYALAAQASLSLTTSGAVLSPVWIGSGIAVVAVLAWGRWMLAGIFVADVATSLVGGIGPLASLAVAAGDTAEAALIAWLLGALGVRWFHESPRDVFALLLAATLGTLVSASVGTAALAAGDYLVASSGDGFLRYWSSTLAGVLLVAPLLQAWGASASRHRVRRAAVRWPWLRALEALLLAALLVAIAGMVFLREDASFLWLLLVFPLLTWASLRFGARGATLATLGLATIGIAGIATGRSEIEGLTELEEAAMLQLLVAVVALGSLALVAAVHQRDRARLHAQELLSVFGHAQELVGVGSWQLRLLPPRGPWGRRGARDAVAAAASTGTVPDILPVADPRRAAEELTSDADAARTPAWCSRELAGLLGIGRDHHGHVQLSELVRAVERGDRERVVAAVREAITAGSRYSVEHAVRDSQGARRVVRHVGTVVDQEDPRGPRIVGAVLDITDQKQVELLKDALVATASHELRTPLTSILGFAQTLGSSWDDVDDEQRRQYLGIIAEQAERLSRIVEDTLMQSRVDTGTVPTRIERIRLRDAVEAAIGDVRQQADPEAGSIEVEIDVPDDLVAIADASHVGRIVTNLLGNALKYGEPPFEVVAHATGPDAVELSVVDHGPGVTPEFEPALFERFARGPDVAMSSTGSGLGLSIVRGMAEAMGGTVVYRREGGRTCFILTLPR